MLATFSSLTCTLACVHDFTDTGIYKVRKFEETVNEPLKILMDVFSGTLIFWIGYLVGIITRATSVCFGSLALESSTEMRF